MDYPTPDGVWCRVCGHGYWQYPDRDTGCPRCRKREVNRVYQLERENKALKEAAARAAGEEGKDNG